MRSKSPNSLPNGNITNAFSHDLREINISDIVPLKITPEKIKGSVKYKQIKSSLAEVGLIEPPVVVPEPYHSNRFILLDGHLRLCALKELGTEHISCLISSDDEAFTYNKHISRLSSIQEHRMILLAIKRGVSEEKIAKALNMDVRSIIVKRDLLNGICQDAADLLKDKMVAVGVFSILKRLKPYRQIEAAMLMNDTQTYTTSYARMIYVATPKNQLLRPDRPKKIKGLSEEEMARMESEMESLQREYQIIEENYGTDVLKLTVAKGYLASLLGNARVVRHLTLHHPEILREFQKITQITALHGGEALALKQECAADAGI